MAPLKPINTKGITLIEVILYVAFMAILVTALLRLYWVVVGAGAYQQTRAQLLESSSVAFSQLEQTVRQADAVDAASIFDVNPSAVVLQNDGTHRFDVADGVLRYQNPLGQTYNLTGDSVRLTDFTVTRQPSVSGPDALQFQLSLEPAAVADDSSVYKATFTTTFTLTLRKEL